MKTLVQISQLSHVLDVKLLTGVASYVSVTVLYNAWVTMRDHHEVEHVWKRAIPFFGNVCCPGEDGSLRSSINLPKRLLPKGRAEETRNSKKRKKGITTHQFERSFPN